MIGRRVGRYEVVSELGRGGMGVVYRARDTELARFVALKSLPADKTESPSRRKRFLHEARSASALSHPNLVPIYDLLSLEGTDWIVMELVEGRSLAAAIPPEGVPVEQALRWAAEIADGLAAAHQAGIIHRDLKPGNVMIGPDGRARVLDFGLAKLLSATAPAHDEATASAPLTRAGAVLGTLEYMSPEQAMARPVDARSDIFSLGVVLYEMLTGRSPFRGGNVASTIHAVAYEAETPPESLRPEIPQELSSVVRRALEKDPRDRCQTMIEMRDTLRALSTGDRTGAATAASTRSAAVTSRLPSLRGGTAAERRARQRRIGIVLAVGAAGVLVAILLARSAGRGAADAEEGAAEAAVATLPATPFQLLRQSQELLSHFWRAGYVDRAIESLQRAVGADPGYAPAYAALAEALLRKFEVERDPIWLERSKANAAQALTLDPSLTSARLALGLALRASGEIAAAEKELAEVVLREPANAQAHKGLADIEAARQRQGEAEARYREAILRAPDRPELHSALGTFLFGAGRYEAAAAAFGAATAAAPDFVYGYRNAAAALHMLGSYDRAAEQLQRALEIRPDAPTYSNLGTLYFFQGLYPQALEAYQRAIELGANDYLVWANLGDAYRWSPGREQDARRAYTRALQLLVQESGGATEDPVVESRRALLLAKQGSRAEARALAGIWADRAADPSSLYRLALAFELAGERTSAVETLAAALARGYSETEIRQDPELTALRDDPAYHLMMVDASAPAADTPEAQ